MLSSPFKGCDEAFSALRYFTQRRKKLRQKKKIKKKKSVRAISQALRRVYGIFYRSRDKSKRKIPTYVAYDSTEILY